MIISLFLALVKPHLEYGVQLPPSPGADADTLEGVWWGAGAGGAPWGRGSCLRPVGRGDSRGPSMLVTTQLVTRETLLGGAQQKEEKQHLKLAARQIWIDIRG